MEEYPLGISYLGFLKLKMKNHTDCSVAIQCSNPKVVLEGN